MAAGFHPDRLVYYLSGNDFLFMPRGVLPAGGTTFVDNGQSKYLPFMNSFRAVLASGIIASPDRHEPSHIPLGRLDMATNFDSVATSKRGDQPPLNDRARKPSMRMQLTTDTPHAGSFLKE